MAAYGALLSLTNTIHQIQNHPRPPISLDKLQIKPLIQMVAFLMQFLENYIIDDVDGLEGRMIDAAHEIEDIVESHIAYHIEARGEANISSNDKDESLYRQLEKVMHDLDSITNDVAALQDKKVGKKIAPSCTEDDAKVGSNDVMNNIMAKLNNSTSSEGDDSFMTIIMDKLTSQQSSRWIIAITGMGGIGKTTLAKRVYENPLIVEHFDIRGWAIVSQEFDSKRILLQVLDCLKITMGNEDNKYETLGQKLYQSLYGRRYLIVMDDIWGTDAWDGVKRFFPINNNGSSRVLMTTRPSNVALQLDGLDYFQMPFLKLDESLNLLRKCVFGEQGCPPELEEIRKDIARKCKGLPLSIVVIGGVLLAKSEQTRENWHHVLENLSSIVNLEEDERCFRILKLSYNQLSVHLKPCFLYMSMFSEEDKIHIPTLMRLWVDEGFVKPVAGKSFESTAREVYLHGLVVRNLILVRTWGPTRRIKWCGIHDLLRDLCIKEAEKYKFSRTTKTKRNLDHVQSWRARRRIAIHRATSEREYISHPLPQVVQSTSRARTLIWKVDGSLPSLVPFRLLKVLNGYDKSYHYYQKYAGQELFLPVNLCHLVAPRIQFPVEIFYRLWNLHTLIVDLGSSVENWLPMLDICGMPQLRHVNISRFQLRDMEEENGCMVLENKLETLKTVWNLRLGEKMVQRMLNIKKLEILYDKELLSPHNLIKKLEILYNKELLSPHNLDNLCRLQMLEDLSYSAYPSRRIEVTFLPISLKKLTLWGTCLGWEEMETKIGSLPYLESLRLMSDAFVGAEWETAEGGFQRLKYMAIKGCRDLEQWRAEATHFPSLERLELWHLYNLKEIPLGIRDITTLREIHVSCCPDSVVISANKILEEQEAYIGEVDLQIRVSLVNETQLQEEKLRNRNFTVV